MAVAPMKASVGPLFVGTARKECLPGPGSLLSFHVSRKEQSAERMTLLDLPCELLEAIMFDTQLNLQDITSLGLCCKRFAAQLGNDQRWKVKFVAKYGCRMLPVTDDAAVIAGSWQKLFRSRKLTEKTSPDVQCPCPEEVDALLLHAGRKLSNDRRSLLLFLVDTSSSVSEADYKAMTDFMSHAHGKLGQRFAELEVCLCQFSGLAQIEIQPEKMETSQFRERAERMGRLQAETRIANALDAGMLIAKEAAEADKVIMLLSDGDVDDYDLERATKVCGDLKGLEPSPVFASIGVGRVNIDGMRSMAHAAGASAPEQYFPLHVGFS